MKRLILAAMLSAICATAMAQTMTLPKTYSLFFVGTTDELNDIREALDQAQCLVEGDPVTYNYWPEGVCGHTAPFQWPNYFCYWSDPVDPCGHGPQHMIGEPYGLGAVDCLAFPESFLPSIAPLLGQTVEVNGRQIAIPPGSGLATDSELPTECRDYLMQMWCPESDQEWWCWMGCVPEPC